MRHHLLRVIAIATLNLSLSANAVRNGSSREVVRQHQYQAEASHQAPSHWNDGSSSSQHTALDDGDIFTNRIHHHALLNPHGPDPPSKHHFRYDDARIFENFQFSDGEDVAEEDYTDEGISIESLQEGDNFDYDSDDEARYYDEGLEPMEDAAPLWDPNYYSIWDIASGKHFTQGQFNYEDQIIDPITDDPGTLQELKQELEDAQINGYYDQNQLREMRRGERNQSMRTQALEHISVLKPDRIGSYTGCLYVPQRSQVFYNSALKPEEILRRYHNHGKKHPHMPSLYQSERSGNFLFKQRRLRPRINRDNT